MRVLITGAGGFIGARLAKRLLADGTAAGRTIARLTLVDLAAPTGFEGDPRVASEGLDVADPAATDALVARGFDLVFHLAAVVSAAAEADLDLGLAVNLDGTRHLLEAARRAGGTPRFVFASSCAVYGGELPSVVTDTTHLTPQTSYGAQKAASELLVGDYARKGLVDGRSLRLPTIVVRPGRPNKAASTFASSIVREPLKGEPATCPVPVGTAMYALSPRKVVDAFVRAAALPAEAFGPNRSLVLPGVTVTVGGLIEAMGRIAGPEPVTLVTHVPDPAIERIVRTWPARFAPERALALGFEADDDADAIVRQHVDDELGGQVARAAGAT